MAGGAEWVGFGIMAKMKRLSSRTFLGLRIAVALFLLLLSMGAVFFAFPNTASYLRSVGINGLLLFCLGTLFITTLWSLWRRRWLSVLFHLGASLVIIGGGLTAGYAQEGQIVFTDSPYAPTELRQCLVAGDRVALHSFEIVTYPDGMPKQYITRLVFPEGLREVSVNAPLRRKGWTYYQMSYQSVTGYYGEPVFNTVLTVRRDPGALVTFWGYGVLIFAAFTLAIRQTLQTIRIRRQQEITP